jgi:hypothetical protein
MLFAEQTKISRGICFHGKVLQLPPKIFFAKTIIYSFCRTMKISVLIYVILDCIVLDRSMI